MEKLTFLNLATNFITRIAPQNFKGATRLMVLLLQGNEIVSVDAAAFQNLAAMQVTPEIFKNGSDSYANSAGIGACSDRMLVFHMRLCWTLWIAVLVKHAGAPLQVCHDRAPTGKGQLLFVDYLYVWFVFSMRRTPIYSACTPCTSDCRGMATRRGRIFGRWPRLELSTGVLRTEPSGMCMDRATCI